MSAEYSDMHDTDGAHMDMPHVDVAQSPVREAAKRWAAVAVAVVLVVGATAAAPAGLRRVDAFRIENVEVHGAFFMTADQVVAASGVSKRASTYDETATWVRTLEEHPLIARAEITRRLPSTLVIRITETKPIAFAQTPELRPVDAQGRVLPADPTYVDMDLPVILSQARMDAKGRLLDSATVRAALVLSRIQELEPAIAPWITQAIPLSDGVQLSVRGPANAEVLLPFDVDARRLHELRVTLADLAASPVAGGVITGDSVPSSILESATRIDVRYREQVVVSLNTGTH